MIVNDSKVLVNSIVNNSKVTVNENKVIVNSSKVMIK